MSSMYGKPVNNDRVGEGKEGLNKGVTRINNLYFCGDTNVNLS